MALKSSREGLRKELVDYLGNLIVDDNLSNEIIKAVGDRFVTPEILNENVNNLTMQITTESGKRIDADDVLQNNINAETTARQEAIANLEELITNSGLKVDLLWTNASPTTLFNDQIINLDLSKYKYLIIVVRFSIAVNYFYTNIVSKNLPQTLFGGFSYSNSGISYRLINQITGSQIEFGYGGYLTSTDYGIEANDNAIPYQIYGVK